MNLNDPFGRMQTKRQREYESLCRSLREAGLTGREEAEALIESMRRRCRLGLAVIVPGTLLLALAFPEARVLVVALGGIAALWLFNASRRGQEYVARYIREELRGGSPAVAEDGAAASRGDADRGAD